MRLWDRLARRAGYWEGLASGAAVLTNSYGSSDREAVLPQLAAFAQQSYGTSSIVFAAILVRMALFSEARFQFQAKDDKHLFGNETLAKLEEPFGPGTTTGELLVRMEQDASLAGQAYIWDPPGEDPLVRLGPDWATFISRGGTVVLDQGAELTVVGSNLSQLDFANVAAGGVERILADANVPGVLVGLEPLRGAGRGYQESMQKLANLYGRPQWRSACGALSQLLDVPAGNRLWFDTSDIAALQDGEMERGQAALVRAQALLALVQAGYTHESAIAAVDAMDLSQLKAGGLGTPASSAPVQHMLPQAQPRVTASPLPPALGRLPVGPASVGDGGDNSRPTPRPVSARRMAELNGHQI